jgi:hypothetical protein
VPATRSRKPRSVMLRDAEISDAKRRSTLVIDAEPAVTPIDLDALQPAEANIVPAGSTEVVVAPLRKVHTTTVPAKIRDSFADGEAILGIGIAAAVVAAIVFVTEFVLWATAVVGALIAVLPTVLGLLAMAILVRMLWSDHGKGGAKTVVVKGCAKGPTPGPQTLRR